jgi:hypothetical protein
MSDILDVHEQDAIADTLVAPLHSTYEGQDTGTEYSHADGENIDYGQEEQEQSADEAQELNPEQGTDEPTEEQQTEWMQHNEAFDSMPEAQQFEQCSQSLAERYAQVQADLDPQVCQEWAQKIVAEHGFAGLESNFDATALATVAESASSNFEETLSFHPAAPAWREAAGQYFELTPEQRQSAEGQKLYASAVRAAMPLSNRTMCLAVLNDLGVVLNSPNLARSGNPQLLVAQLVMDVAEDAGWASQLQSRNGASRSIFQTNNDLFDDETMEEVARRGLL